MSAFSRSARLASLLFFSQLYSLATGAFINYDNCMPQSIVDPSSGPLHLQWIPLAVDAKFSRVSPYNLNVTIYGNVSGQQVDGTYPPPDDPSWSNNKSTFGKIADVGSSGNYSTLLAEFMVLTYDAYNAKASQFCNALENATCPLGPAFNANDTDPATLPAFSISHNFGSPYSFSTLNGKVTVLSGDTGAPLLACIQAQITPYLGNTVTGLITWLPAAILIVKALATISAAIWSPWGSTDIFRWSSNYGRDEDQLRLVTPGFGDCLQYIQFVTLTGALSLQYPGFYQPAVSQTGWSLLLFNESFVSGGNGTVSLVDGIYKYNGTYGMTAMSQLIGMSTVEDIWACMAVFLLVITGTVVLLCQLGFLGRWIYRTYTNTTEEDLRQKNLPFTLGNIIRLLFNYFILPIVSLSLFQLVISTESPSSVVACAVILLVIIIVAAGWIFRVIFTTKPRTYLFDDMPTVLLYGPLYNTYSDSAAPFALVPVFITFIRAVALGAIQPSGIGQIIVLAICEVILLVTLNGFRPFQTQTSMNAYHTFFAIARLAAVLLSIAFVPSLNVSEAPKGWIAYAILLLHSFVLIFGFFLNSLQTLIEVVARSCGVAGDSQTGAIRGSIMNWRMLKKRQLRPATADRASMNSHAAMLQDTDARSAYAGGRSRSLSASSQQLLNQAGSRMSGFENFSQAGDILGSPGQESDQLNFGGPGGAAAGLAVLKRGNSTDKQAGVETYYRPPRPRRATLEQLGSMGTPGTKTRQSTGIMGDFPYQDSPEPTSYSRAGSCEVAGYPPGRDSPAPAYFRDRQDSNENLPRPDYAVREVDQYYRGPALSDQPTRKLKTGPADPEGPAAHAQSWFQRLVGGVKAKQKEPSKGFEVVRSSRLPAMQSQHPNEVEMQNSPPMHLNEPYHDSPNSQVEAVAGAHRDSLISSLGTRRGAARGLGLDGAATRSSDPTHPGLRAEQPSVRSRPSADTASNYDRPRSSSDSVSNYNRHPSGESGKSTMEEHVPEPYRVSAVPTLDPIEGVGDIDMPSRWGSRRSANLDAIDLEHTEGGQNWLREVENLNWPQPQPHSSYVHPGSARQSSPPIPDRHFRRHFSTDSTDRPSMPRKSESDDIFSGFDSAVAGAQDDGFRAPNSKFTERFDGDVRPSSFASVSHHRAADSISRNSFGASAALQGESAEFSFADTPPNGNAFGSSAGYERW